MLLAFHVVKKALECHLEGQGRLLMTWKEGRALPTLRKVLHCKEGIEL